MISPNEAAKRAGVSRPTIVKLIKNGEIEAIRNNRNHWQIDPDSLEKWLKEQPETSTEISVKSSENNELETEVAVLRERLAGKDELIAQLRQELAWAKLPWWKRMRGGQGG